MTPSAAARRRTEQRQHTRDRLIDSATKLFLEQGYGETSIDRVAEHAGFTSGAVQRNFRTKAHLADAVLERFYGQVIYQVSAQMAALPTSSPAADFDAFVQLVTGWIEAAVRSPAWVRLELDLAAERGHAQRDQADGTDEPERLGCLRALSAHILETTAAAVGIRLVVEPKEIVTYLVAVVVGMTLQNEEPGVAADLVRPLVQHLLRPADATVRADDQT
ncbi:TetR/AcrR family transcriptional regulator [Nocardia brasiliensis]|uniref:TetR/AcrR family transcriptional regulator n=1 Tax=Nocardia brasiliensis TaxID=37326 RepID=UPI00245568E4|nr:TetR/AcrR family transcriptional regulator [Nocardia brasiliensis]